TRFSRDWSSDVCSSDLGDEFVEVAHNTWIEGDLRGGRVCRNGSWDKNSAPDSQGFPRVSPRAKPAGRDLLARRVHVLATTHEGEIGRASCRDSGSLSGV